MFSNVTYYPSQSFQQTWPVGKSGPSPVLDWFPQWATVSPTFAVAGDFDGDHLSDIALVQNFGGIALALSNGDGTFRIVPGYNGFPFDWVNTSGVRVLAGDFDKDGYTDIALAGGSGWQSVPVAFSNGDGTFTVTNNYVDATFAWYAQRSPLVSGDFNGDGRFDVGVVANYQINYVPYIPEFVSLGRTGWVSYPELRGYVNANSQSDSVFNPAKFTAVGAY
jgi:hypothetical protein